MHIPFETDRFPVIRARFFRKVTERRAVRLIVIHSMEAPEKGSTAENIARFFQNPGPNRKVSAHLCIDNDSIVQCVFDNDVAFAAPGANHDGIQIELAGFARQTREEWLDAFGVQMLDRAANATAQYCLKYDIPVRRLTDEQLGDGASKGIISHSQASEVFKGSTHTDPGKGFPWDHFLEQVAHHRVQRLAHFQHPVAAPAGRQAAGAEIPAVPVTS